MPNCGALVASGYCDHHTRERERRRGTAAQRGYDAAHGRRRQLVLARDPICRGCGRAPSDVDDHIVPIALGGSKSDLDNQQGLCTPCHGYKTATEQRDPFFGLRLRQAGAAIGEPAPLGWRDLKPFGGTR